jgi:hypothetical protein
MNKQPDNIEILPPELPKDIALNSLQHAAAEHDEWLQALAETFPASDSIAVSPHSLLRAASSIKKST